jgi:hypothetical protein
MDENELAELLIYSNPKELYVVNWRKKLKVLYCPFKVKVKHPIGNLQTGQIVLVEEIKVTPEVKTVFIINKIAYYYYHFIILSQDL